MIAERTAGQGGSARRALTALVFAGALLAGCEFMMSAEDRIARAERELAAGNPAAAMVDLKNVLQKESTNDRARLLLARTELALGDTGAASADLAKIDATRVDAAEYEPLRWRVALADRKFDEIAAALVSPRAGLPEPLRLTILGRALAAQGEGAAAREVLERAVAADARNGEALAALASSIAASGDVAGATARLEAAAAQLPDSVDVQQTYADMLMRTGRHAAAEQGYRRALELAGGDRLRRLAAYSGLADALFAQQKLDDVARLSGELRKSTPGAGLTLLVAGRLAAARRDYTAALDNFTRLLNADPENATLRTMVAGINVEQGNLEQAASNLEQVLARQPNNAIARRVLAQVQLAQGRPQDATRTLDALPEDGGGALDVALLRSRAALAAGDATGAAGELEKLEEQGLATGAARLDLAAAYLQIGRADRALRLLGADGADAPTSGDDSDRRERLRLVALASQDRAQALSAVAAYAESRREDPTSLRFAALMQSALGDHEGARRTLGGATTRAPGNADVQLDLARVEARAGRPEAAEAALRKVVELRPDAAAFVALAEIVGLRGREDEALRLLEQARAADASAIAPRLILARAYLARKNGEDAQKVADELLALAPSRPQAHLLASAAALLRKDAVRATSAAQDAVRVAPDSASAWVGKGGVHAELGQSEEARAAYRRALALAPDSPLPTVALARLELAAGNANAALEAARRAQQRDGTRLAGQRLEGEILLRLGRPQEAAAVIEKLQAAQPSASGALALYRARLGAKSPSPELVLVEWLRTHPQDAGLRLALAEHWQREGSPAKAIAEYETLLRARPNDAIALNNLAWLYHSDGDARALATARRARELAPRNPAIADTLGVILVAADQLDEGLALLREAAAGAPAAADIQYHLAEALSRKGEKADAQKIVAGILRDANAGPEVRAKAETLAKQLR